MLTSGHAPGGEQGGGRQVLQCRRACPSLPERGSTVYRLTSLLGVGGMGEVYRAFDERLGREVALKVIHPDLAGTPDAIARLERVAREGMPCYPLFANDPFLAGLRGYPAFDELLARMRTQNEYFRKTL